MQNSSFLLTAELTRYLKIRNDDTYWLKGASEVVTRVVGIRPFMHHEDQQQNEPEPRQKHHSDFTFSHYYKIIFSLV